MKKVIETTATVKSWDGKHGTAEVSVLLPLEAIVIEASGLKADIAEGVRFKCDAVVDAMVIRVLGLVSEAGE